MQMAQQEGIEQRFNFLLKVLQLAKNDDSRVLGSLLGKNPELLDNEMIEVLRTWSVSGLNKVSQDEQNSQAFALVGFGDELHRFSLGNRAVNMELLIKCYSLAAKIFDTSKNIEKWREMQNNLAVAYKERIRGDRADNLEFSIEHYKFALSTFDGKKSDLELAEAQNNLAVAWSERIRGSKSENMDAAIKCCQASQEVLIGFFNSLQEYYQKSNSPLLWAMNQHNLANAYQERFCGDQADNLRRSIEFFNLSLEIYSQEVYPLERGKVQSDLDRAIEELEKDYEIDRLDVYR
jgi:tetratricopeptide (TPR) repeat protein